MTNIDDIAVLTSENVRLNYTLTGMGSRVTAFLADSLIITLLTTAIAFIFMALGMDMSEVDPANPGTFPPGFIIFIIASTLLQWGYYFFFEWLNWGQTPGKHLLGIRVSMADGAPVDLIACGVRNLVRLVDLFLAFIGITFFIMIFTPRYQRLGDLAAGTVVIKRRKLTFDDVLNAAREADRIAASRPQPREPVAGAPRIRISDAERALISKFIERRNALPADVRIKLASDLSARLRSQIPGSEMSELSDEEVIVAVWENDSASNG